MILIKILLDCGLSIKLESIMAKKKKKTGSVVPKQEESGKVRPPKMTLGPLKNKIFNHLITTGKKK